MEDRLREYYDIWDNPRSQQESNMSITYDLKGLSLISRFFRSMDEDFVDEMENVKDSAFELRNRKNVKIMIK